MLRKPLPPALIGMLLIGILSLSAEIRIAEFMASNSSTLTDEDGDYSDWIEIENTGPGTVDLAGRHPSHTTDLVAGVVRFPLPGVEGDFPDMIGQVFMALTRGGAFLRDQLTEAWHQRQATGVGGRQARIGRLPPTRCN